MWICGALLGLMRAKGVATDREINALANGLVRAAADEAGDVQVEMLLAAEWLRYSIPAAND